MYSTLRPLRPAVRWDLRDGQREQQLALVIQRLHRVDAHKPGGDALVYEVDLRVLQQGNPCLDPLAVM